MIYLAPPATLKSVEPSIVSRSDGPRNIVLTGTNLLGVDGVPGTILLDGGSRTSPVSDVLSAHKLSDCVSHIVSNVYVTHVIDLCTMCEATIASDPEVMPFYYPLVEYSPPDTPICTVGNSTMIMLHPPPDVWDVFPPLVCSGASHAINITGRDMLVIDGIKPTVTFGSAEAVPQAAIIPDGCFDISDPPPRRNVQVCNRLTVTFDADSVDADMLHDVHVENPQPALGSTKMVTHSGQIRVESPIEIEQIIEDAICLEDSGRTVKVLGSHLITIDDVSSKISIAGVPGATVTGQASCESISTSNFKRSYNIQSCNEYTVRIPEAAFVTNAIAPDVTAEIPYTTGCKTTVREQLLIVPSPINDIIEYPAVCADGSVQNLLIKGRKYLQVGEQKPTVLVDGIKLPSRSVSLDGCTTPSPTAPRTIIRECTSITITVDPANITADMPAVTVTNPGATDCAATKTVYFRKVPTPTLNGATPPFVCNGDASTNVSISSSSNTFLVLNGVTPTVTIGADTLTALDPTDCIDTGLPDHAFMLCKQVTVVVPKATLVLDAPSFPQIQIIPMTITTQRTTGCASVATSGALAFFPPPVVTNFFPAICGIPGAETKEYPISGKNFLRTDNPATTMTITMAGRPRPVKSWGSCTPIAVAGAVEGAFEVCGEVVADLTDGDLISDQNITVENIAAGGECSFTTSKQIVSDERQPQIVGLPDPTVLCADEPVGGQRLTIQGKFPRVFGVSTLVYLSGKVLQPESEVCTGGESGECTALTVRVSYV